MIASITFDDISPFYLTIGELNRVVNLLEELDVKCTFFVPPCYDKKDSPAVKRFILCLKDILDKGHELALHGYKHTKNEFGCFYPIPLPLPFPTFSEQKKRLEQGLANMFGLVGIKPIGFRAPFYLHNSVTLRALSRLGFYYDSSVTIFKPAHNMHLRIQWLRNCRPSLKEGIVEIPVSGDYTYNLEHGNFNEFLEIAMRDFEWVNSRQGIFVVNNHPQRLGSVSYRFLRTLVKVLSRKVEFSTLGDIAKMYR